MRPSGITELRDVRADVEDAADVVVVGSGAAGAVAARELRAAGLDVVVVEEGPYIGDELLGGDTWSAFKHLWRDRGMQVAQGRLMLPFLQGCAVGGTTVINGAIVHRVPEPIVEAWRRDFGAGELLGANALEDAYTELDRLLSVAPTPEPVWGRNNRILRVGCDALGWQSNAIVRNVRDCAASGACAQGCARGRKQSMLVAVLPDALASGVRMYATSRVDRVTIERGVATGIVGRFRDPRTGERGPALRIRARRAVVLAASAIQTPTLLAASGVGRASSLVGRRLQAHPGAGVLGVFDEPVDLATGATQGAESTHFWNERMKFETVGMPLDVLLGRLPGFGADLMRRAQDASHIAQIGVQVRAEAHGRVRRLPWGAPLISYDLTDADVARLKLGIKRVGQILFAAGARAIHPGIFGVADTLTSPTELDHIDAVPNDPSRFHGIAAHLFGTAVMGTDPQRSVVGPTLECHDAKSLYVFDSSVFPTNMGVNPAHTISAVALLAARGLAGRL